MFKKNIHKLFKCPTFWTWKKSFTCPDCGKKYRCYWDGNDCPCGVTNLCNNCMTIHLPHDIEASGDHG